MRRCALSIALLCISGCGLLLDPDPQGQRPFDGGLDGRVDGGADTSADAVSDAPIFDGFGIDATPCSDVVEICDGLDQDCDGRVDEDFDLANDPSNCGSCGTTCPTTGAVPTCNLGACELVCLDGRANCDDDPDNGCESDLSARRTCGSCTRNCDPDMCIFNATTGSHECGGACLPGEAACSGACVDLSSDLDHCGDCGNTCTAPDGALACTMGSCEIVGCRAGWADCNGVVSDGCETSLASNLNCGSCGTPCASTERCMGGSCMPITCDDPLLWGFAPVATRSCAGTCGGQMIYCDSSTGICYCSGAFMGTYLVCTGAMTCEDVLTLGCCGL